MRLLIRMNRGRQDCSAPAFSRGLHVYSFLFFFGILFFSCSGAPADERDVLARAYADFDMWGGVEVRLSAADSDVADLRAAATAVPALAAARKRVFRGGQLPALGCEPIELSLALTDDPAAMRVSWATMDRELLNPRVEILGSPCPLASGVCSFPADTRTYAVLQKWWPTFNGSLHTAVVAGLEAGARYSYRVGSDSADAPPTTASPNGSAWSLPASFAAAPAGAASTVVALLADQGTVMPLGFAVAEKLAAVQDERAVALVLHVGDLSYAGIDAAVPKLNISSVRPRAKARGNRRATASLFLCGRLPLQPHTHQKYTALLKPTRMHKTLTRVLGGASCFS